MKKLKEYAGVIVALVTVMTAVSSLNLWAIQVQIEPEIRRLDGRIDVLTDRLDHMDAKWEIRFDGIEARFDGIEVRFAGIEARVNRIESDIKTIEGDIKTILLRLPKQPQTG